jgi:hypothetical protein
MDPLTAPPGLPGRYLKDPNLLILDLRSLWYLETHPSTPAHDEPSLGADLPPDLIAEIYLLPLPTPKVTFRYHASNNLTLPLTTIGQVVTYDFPVVSKKSKSRDAHMRNLRWQAVKGWPLARKPFTNPGPDQLNKGLVVTFI